MEAESSQSRQGQPPIMVDISTGEEYLNGEVIPQEPPLEVVLFKFRQNHEASLPPNYSGNSRCDLTDCYCDDTSKIDNVKMFCDALRTIAECRGRMCPYTIATLLKDELFEVLFEWIEMGDEWDPREGHGEDSESIPNHETCRRRNSSSSSDHHSDERLPQEEVISNDLSPISSTTSPPAPCAENQNGNTSTADFAWAGFRVKNSALELVRNMDVDEDNTSSEPEISQVHNESRESEENTGAVEPPELPSTTVENQLSLNPQQAVSEEPEPETQETSSHHEDDSSSPPEYPTISDLDAQAAAVAVPNVSDTNEVDDVSSVSANSSLPQSDKNAISAVNESVPSDPVVENVFQPPNVPKSNSEVSQSDSNSTLDKNKSDLNTQKPTRPPPPSNETDSQPPEQPRRHWEENEGFGKGLPSKLRKSTFDSSGDCARVRQWLEMQYTSSVNISDVQENDDQSPASEGESELGEELEEGEIDSPEETQQPEASETQKKTEAPADKTMKATISSEKRITRSGTNSPVPCQSEEGVRTRSRSSVPGPASVKRDRESRAAKKSAQSKISSMLGVAPETATNEEDNVASSPAKDSTAVAGKKRFRNSESGASPSDETPNQHQTRSTVNKSSLSRRKRQKVFPDENSSDVPSCSSRSSTPTLDESNHHPETRSRQERRNSASPIATRQSQKFAKVLEKPQRRTSNDKTSTEERMITNTEDSGSSDSDESSSSDSGESHVSEIPLAERLEKKRKREDKERRKALKSNETSDEARSRRLERKRKKKQGLSPILLKPESSSTLRSKLSFRIPDLPTNAKKAEAAKSSTLAILQAAKSHNSLDRQQKSQVETETEKVVTNNEDDDILMVEVVEVSKKTTSAGAQNPVKRSNSTEGGTSTAKKGGIHISLKDKSKGLTPQRSLSIPGTSPTNVPENASTSPPKRIDLGIPPLGKSLSLPLSTPDELNITVSSEVDLEDQSRWEFPQKTFPRNTPQISLGVITPKTNESVQQEQDKSKSQLFPLEKIQSLISTPGKNLIIINEKETPSQEPTCTPSTSQKPGEIPSTSKKPTATPTPSTSKDPKAAPSVPNKVPTSIPSSSNQKTSSENVKQVSPSKNASDDLASRNSRARKQVFDPKAEAAKPIPKPVPKVTKEILQQQQITKSTPVPVPSTSVSKTATVTTAASSTPQKESSSLPSKSKEPTTQSMPQKTPEKSQQQQQDKPGRPSESSARKETGESASSSKVSAPGQQRDRSGSPRITPKSNPPSMSATFADGEIRLLPIKPITSSSPSSTSTSGTSGTWRRGGPTDNRREQEKDFAEDTVDFETPPDDDDDRRRSSSKNRERNRSGASSRSSSSSSGGGNRNYRGGSGGGHQQPYRYQGPPRGGGGGPPRQFYDGGGRGHPRSRPPFSGGPRANMINTVVSHGRYQNPEEFSQDFLPGMPHPNQFPPPPMEMQFNRQFGPPPGMYPMMGGPRPPFFHNQQFPPRWPRYRM